MVTVKVIKFLDKYIGFLLCLILSLGKIFSSKKNIIRKNILLIQLWGIGETVLSLPTIKALREKSKKSDIEVLVTSRVNKIFYNNKNVNKIIILKLNPFSILSYILKNHKKYDLVIDMEEYLNISSIIAFFAGKARIGYSHGIRSNLYTETVKYNDKQHIVYTFLDLLKPLGIKKEINNLERLNYSDNDEKNIEKILKKNNIGKKNFIVGLGVGAAESAKSRMWPKERFAKVADYLIGNHKAKIIFIGNEQEKNFIENIQQLMINKKNTFNSAGKTNIREMFYLVSLCNLFIGNDSGPMHVAAAQGVKTIGLFGCNLPIRFGPFGKNNYFLYKKKGEACINVHKGQVGECKYGKENACVKKIEVDDVVKLILKIKPKRN